jgi:hypothetical protein
LTSLLETATIMASTLRQRRQAASQSSSDLPNEDAPRARGESLTELPVLQANGQPATERTSIPASSSKMNWSRSDSGIMDTSVNGTTTDNNNNNQTQSQVAKAEGKKRKIAVRVISSVLMIGTFLGLMYMGHAYICLLVALVELLLVRRFWMVYD